MPDPVRTLVVDTAGMNDKSWIDTGGHPHTVFRLTPDELLRIAAGRVVRVA